MRMSEDQDSWTEVQSTLAINMRDAETRDDAADAEQI